MIREEQRTLYVAIDGKSFWDKLEALTYDSNLPFLQHFQKTFPKINLENPDVGFWKIRVFHKGLEKVTFGGGFMGGEIEEKWVDSWILQNEELVQGTPQEIYQYVVGRKDYVDIVVDPHGYGQESLEIKPYTIRSVSC